LSFSASVSLVPFLLCCVRAASPKKIVLHATFHLDCLLVQVIMLGTLASISKQLPKQE
jgi:hypothetical protein